ncbi:unnamed protein product [Cunninghamella blakesleeana]
MQRPRRRSFEQNNNVPKERPTSPTHNRSLELPMVAPRFYGLSSTQISYSSTPNMNQLQPSHSDSTENDPNINPSQPRQIPPKDKKRHLFSRFKKKNRSDSQQSDISGTATPTPQTSSQQQPRKRSREQEVPLSTYPSTHSFESQLTDEVPLPKGVYNYYGDRHGSTTTMDRRKFIYHQKNRRQHSEDITSFMSRDTELDHNFGTTDDIGKSPDAWSPPVSWAVEPANISSAHSFISNITVTEEEQFIYDDYDEPTNWNIKQRNFCIRIFRSDNTFGTMIVPLNITTKELIKKIVGKFFLSDHKNYSLLLGRHNLDRVLLPNERPLQIQKQLLEQMGYTDDDKLEDVGREDNSYLFRFVFEQRKTPNMKEADFVNFQHVGLQGRNLSTIPPFLYSHAHEILSLDLTKNLWVEIPLDFMQSCKQLKELWLMDNEYTSLPFSIRHATQLEHLNISGNRLRDLSLAHLEDIPQLKSLRAFNNKLESLPETFDQLKQLNHLNISNNCLTAFPLVLCDMVQLTYLDISFNKMAQLPDEIGNLKKLVSFFAIGIRLSGSLPLTFSELENLQQLDLRQNSITDLDELCLLPKLDTLFMDYNAVSLVSCEIKYIRQLQLLKNNLTQFNMGFCYPPGDTNYKPQFGKTLPPYEIHSNLQVLNLSHCKLSSLPDDVFYSTHSIKHLTLDSNILTSLPDCIGLLKNLQELSIQDNKLNSLPEDISKLSELKVLLVQKNNLQCLPRKIWLCSSLQTLNCSSNLLETFPEPFNEMSGPMQSLFNDNDNNNKNKINNKNESSNMDNNTAVNVGQGIVPSSSSSSLSSEQQSIHRDIRNLSNDSTGTGRSSISNDSIHQKINRLPPHSSPPTSTTASANNSHSTPIFNPPSFFTSPRNHPPPLSLSLQHLFLGDNRLTDDVWSPLSLFLELRTLNLSFNELYEIPPEGLCHQHLYELYLSGNTLTSLPADDLEKLCYLRVLAVNDNKLQTLPAEIGKLRKLLVLDVGNNVLKYNINNWPYDWNWNWNLGLKYLNLSGNKRLEIKQVPPEHWGTKEKDLADFSALQKLRMLGLMDLTILVTPPEEYHDRRVRTSPTEVNGMGYGVADWLGLNDHLSTWDLVIPKFRNKDDECLFALFDGHRGSKTGCKITKHLNDSLTFHLTNELNKNNEDDTVVSAIRRTFLGLEKDLGIKTTANIHDIENNIHNHPTSSPLMNNCNSNNNNIHNNGNNDSLHHHHHQQSIINISHFNHHLNNHPNNTNSNNIIHSFHQYQSPGSMQDIISTVDSNKRQVSSGASAAVCYISGKKLYVANVGDVLVILSKNNGQAHEITQKHIPLNPGESSRIRAAGGYVSNSGLLNDELTVSRSFGYFHLVPIINANPYISVMEITENDEFLIMASQGLWECMSYQTAVDIARTEKEDSMLAAQKLRDFAISYGADDNIMVMVICIGDLYQNRNHLYQRNRHFRGAGPLGKGGADLHMDDTGILMKGKRRVKEMTVDSTLARLGREVPPPINQVALVFTDIKSSTALWESVQEDMRSSIKIHDEVMRRTLRNVGGYEVKTEGDAFMVCFQNITGALLWCFTVQLQLLEADWPAAILETEEGREIEDSNGNCIYRGLSVRMGIHWGAPVFERNPITNRMDYFGPVVNKASRICNAADGGEICVSSDVIVALKGIPGILESSSNEVNGSGNVNDDDDDQTSNVNHSLNQPQDEGQKDGMGYLIRDIQQLKGLGFHVMELGERRLKGLETPEMLSFVFPKQLSGRMETDKSEFITTTNNNNSNNNNNNNNVSDENMNNDNNMLALSTPIPPSNEITIIEDTILSNSTSSTPIITPFRRSPLLSASKNHHFPNHYYDLLLPSSVSKSTHRFPYNDIASRRLSIMMTTESINHKRHSKSIDPLFVCALFHLAIRLERLTVGESSLSSSSFTSTSTQHHYHHNNLFNSSSSSLPSNFASPTSALTSSSSSSSTSLLLKRNPSSSSSSSSSNNNNNNNTYLDILERHIMETASDEELIQLMDNFVTRVENAVSSLYLQKLGRFTPVLEKLGKALDLDPNHILHALQMYSDYSGLSQFPHQP